MQNQRIHLLACPGCRRQLDVTALEPGDEVMCVCDRRLSVGPPKVVTVRGLCCKRCGGTVSDSDTSCTFCSAALSAEDKVASTLCPSCAERIPNDSRHCKSCGVALRAAAVPPLPADGKCPRCEGRLMIHLLEDAELIECADEAGCGGMWCSKETFDRLRVNAERGAMGLDVEPPGLDPSAPSARRVYIPCITCGQLMQRRQFRYGGKASRIVLDVCKDHGVWFDRDELQAALTVVRQRRHTGLENPAPMADYKPPASVSRMPIRTNKAVASGGLESLIYGILDSIFG